ncbi:hypothetical protein Ga0076813_14114, partial [endosymbiont of Ridgeia piscesae]
MSRPAF